MAEPAQRSPLLSVIACVAAFLCVLLCAAVSFMWVRAERDLGSARVQLERALQHRAEVNASRQKTGENGAADLASLRDEVRKLSGEVKLMKAKLARAPRRSYGPEQATGEPDVFAAGDNANAWCPMSADGQVEWLQLEYEEAVTIAAVKVYENYGPGALTQITIVDDNGKETAAWKGIDPIRPGAASGIAMVPLAGAPRSKRIRIYLDSPAVAGWQEIDAVGIVEPDGKTHWAVSAEASSTYGDPQQQHKTIGQPLVPERNEAPLEF